MALTKHLHLTIVGTNSQANFEWSVVNDAKFAKFHIALIIHKITFRGINIKWGLTQRMKISQSPPPELVEGALALASSANYFQRSVTEPPAQQRE
jgi:hypothetical protein